MCKIDMLIPRGTSAEDLLARIDRSIDKRMSEMRADCLTPDDLVDYQTRGQLHPDLELHRSQCPECDAFLRASVPDPNRIRETLKRVRDSNILRQRLSRSRVSTHPWNDWRVPVAGMAMVTIVLLAILDRPSGATNPRQGLVLTAEAKHGNESSVPVSVRLGLTSTSSARITDADVKIAASTAALAKNPPAFTLPPYGSTSPRVDLHREATERTVALLAGIMSKWASSEENHELILSQAAEQVQGVEVTPIDKRGNVHLTLAVENQFVKTYFNLDRAVATATQYEPIIDQQWKNAKRSSLQPIILDSDVRIECARPLK
jgi:hypothetical protein